MLARKSRHYRYIANDTTGIVFFGTPHQSSSPSASRRAAFVMASLTRPFTNTRSDIIKAIKPESHTLKDIDEAFREILSQYQITGFYETKSSPGGFVLVDRASASLGAENEHLLPIDKPHAEMCRFRGREDQDYLQLMHVLQRMLKCVLEQRDQEGLGASGGEVRPGSVASRKGIMMARNASTDSLKSEVMKEFHVQIYQFMEDSIPEDDDIGEPYGFVRSQATSISIDQFFKDGLSKSIDSDTFKDSSSSGTTNPIIRWIHVPANNMSWVRPTFKAVLGEDVAPSILDFRYWVSREQKARHNAPHARFMDPGCQFIPTNPRTNETRQLSIFLPYIHWDTQASRSQRAWFFKKLAACTTGVPVRIPSFPIEDRTKLVQYKLATEYIPNSDLPLHPRRTLAQFFYWHLSDTLYRDDQQIISKQTRNDPGGPKVLMVDQLWLWIADDDSVISFFPPKEKVESQPFWKEADLEQAILDEAQSHSFGCKSPFELVALIVELAITAVLSRTTNGAFKFMAFYREAIGSAAEAQNIFFRKFQIGLLRLDGDGRLEATGQLAQSRNEELKLALEVADIIDELNSFMRVLEVQNEVLKTIIRNFSLAMGPVAWSSPTCLSREILERTQTQLEDYQIQLERMRTDAAHVHQSVLNLLDLKQKEANIDEARSSRRNAEETASQGRTLMIFTVVTIVFAPLSFFTSYFGMNVVELTGDKENIKMGEVWIYTGPLTVAIVVTAVLMASGKLRRRVWAGILWGLLRVGNWVGLESLGGGKYKRWERRKWAEVQRLQREGTGEGEEGPIGLPTFVRGMKKMD